MNFKKLVLSACLVLGLAGCEQGRQSLADMFKPPTPAEVNVRLLRLASDGYLHDALQLGEDFLKSHPDPQGILHGTLARFYAEAGDTESAVRHLQKLNGRSGGVILLPGQDAPPAAPSPAERESAVATISPNGIEVRAGGATASIRN
jgi:hypothetical protein